MVGGARERRANRASPGGQSLEASRWRLAAAQGPEVDGARGAVSERPGSVPLSSAGRGE